MKKGLGRGLNSLISVYDDYNDTVEKSVKNVNGNEVLEIDINKILPNKNQPRRNFDQQALDELASSIRQHGVVQPIIVCPKGDDYQIIAGERRWRASQIAEKSTIPCIVKKYSEKEIKEVALIENLQRQDLNPIEAARAIKDLMKDYGWTHEAVADRLGKSRPSISNMLRLLNLSPEVIRLIEEGKISMVHGRALVVITDPIKQLQLANYVIENKISTTQLEKMVSKIMNPEPKKEKTSQSIELKEFASDMTRLFSTKVSIMGNDQKGRIYIDYFTRDDLDRIYELLESLKK